MRKLSLICLFGMCALAVGTGVIKAAGLPDTLRCEFLANPIGVTRDKPALSWQIKDSRRGASQTAYRVQVASAPERLENNKPDLWDSGKIESDQSHLVAYQGKPLLSGKRIWWRVQYWDQNGIESGWSEPTWWEMGLLKQEEFKGEWISAVDQPLPEGDAEQQWVKDASIPEAGQWLSEEYREKMNKASREFAAERLKEAIPAYQMRREFDLPEPIRRARLYICTLGYHEIMLNGQKLDEDRLDPGFSHYSVRADYLVKDVTAKLKTGRNCLGLLLGNGRYHEQPSWNYNKYFGKKPVVKAMLLVETESGKSIEITTDRLWKSDVSHITRDSFWVGEVQDARRLQAGWDEAGFDDGKWKGVEIVSVGLPETVDAQIYPPEKEMERIKPVALTNPAPGVWVFDMGRTLVGNAELKISAPRGTAVSVRYAHLLWGEYPDWYRDAAALFCPSYPDMSIARQAGMIVAKQRGDTLGSSPGLILNDQKTPALKRGTPYLMNADLFITQGEGVEIFQRRFGYRPFRYVEVRGFPGKPSLDDVTGVVLHTYLDNGNRSFLTSNDLLNQIELAGARSVLYSFHSHFQDNTGAEKGFHPHQMIWNYPQMALGGESASLTQKALKEIRAFTQKEGLSSLFCGHRRPPGPAENVGPWMSISEMQHYVRLPWVYYLYYGDRRELELHYDVMKRYIQYLYRNVESKGFLLADQYGDVWDSGANLTKFVEGKGYSPEGKFGTPKEFYATAFGYRMVKRACAIAELLGHTDDAAEFGKLRDGARAFIQKEFYEPEGPSYCSKRSSSIQGSHALAIDWELADQKDVPALVSQIKEDLNKNGRPTTGSRLSWSLLFALSRHGAVDSAYEIMTRTTYPSIGHQLPFYGAIPEGFGFPGLPHKGSPVQTELSGMTAWFYEDLCGLQPDDAQPGFKHFFIAPKVPIKLDSAEMEYQSPYGRIKISWKKSTKSFLLNVTVPPNTTATVAIPLIGNVANPVIREGKDDLSEAQGVRVIETSKAEVTCEVQSGSYSFSYDVGTAE
jgi:alpha-L-rhamnosidase